MRIQPISSLQRSSSSKLPGEPKWLDGSVTEKTGPVSHKVFVGDELWERHIDEMPKSNVQIVA